MSVHNVMKRMSVGKGRCVVLCCNINRKTLLFSTVRHKIVGPVCGEAASVPKE